MLYSEECTSLSASLWHRRGDMADIARQQLQHKIDLMIGGGKQWFAPLADEVRKLPVFFLCLYPRYRNDYFSSPSL